MDDIRQEFIDGYRLEEDWLHALDAADVAVSAAAHSHTLRPREVATATDHIRSERKWLSGFTSSLHKMFPARRRRAA